MRMRGRGALAGPTSRHLHPSPPRKHDQSAGEQESGGGGFGDHFTSQLEVVQPQLLPENWSAYIVHPVIYSRNSTLFAATVFRFMRSTVLGQVHGLWRAIDPRATASLVEAKPPILVYKAHSLPASLLKPNPEPSALLSNFNSLNSNPVIPLGCGQIETKVLIVVERKLLIIRTAVVADPCGIAHGIDLFRERDCRSAMNC